MRLDFAPRTTPRMRDTVDVECDLIETGRRAARTALFDNHADVRIRFARVRDRAQDAEIKSIVGRLRRRHAA